ncbi:hypothetical protein Tco_0535851 [Tanacetum coccineum]
MGQDKDKKTSSSSSVLSEYSTDAPILGDRASQDEFTKIKNVTEKDNVVAEIGDEIFREREKVSERVKRGGEKLLEVARGSINI